MLSDNLIPKNTTATHMPPDETIDMSARCSGRSRAATGTGIRRATFLILVGLLPTCLARLGAGASMSSADIVAASTTTIVAGNAPVEDILTNDRELGSKSSKTKSSKSKSSKTKSSKSKSSKKKNKKNSVFNKAGDSSSSQSKKNKKSSSSSKSKKKSSSSKKSSDKKKSSSSDEKRKDSSKSDSKKRNKAPDMDDITKEVVSILKDRKNIVNGKDKTKDLDQKDLRNKVLDELDIKDSDRGEAKKMFDDAIEKLEKKDEIKVDGDGDVKIFVSMDDSDSDSDDKKKKSESLELTDVTKEVVSILKDRKKVVDGEDKTKTLDQKKLRDKVLDELDVKDSDRGEAKDLFEEALKKLEKKDEIKVNGDGDVKIHVSMDHSKDSSSSDEKDLRSSNAATTGGIFGQATVEDAVPTVYTNTTSANGDGLANRPDSTVLPTDPDAPVPLDHGDSIIIIDNTKIDDTVKAWDAVEGPNSANEIGDDASASNKSGADLLTGGGESASGNDAGDTDADSLANGVEDASENVNGDSSTIDLSGKPNGSCGTGCKVGVSFAGVGLLVGVASVAAKMAMAKKYGEEEDFESDEEEEAENDPSLTPAAEEEV